MHRLSDREFEVLCHLAWGGRDESIGKALFIAPDTVKFHVRHILRKLGARNRSHAVAIAYRSGALGRLDLTAPEYGVA